MSKRLNQIKSPISKELEEFEEKFKLSMKSNVPLLDKITWYLVQRKGKQIRPILVLLCARLFGEINEKTHVAASLVELLHTATLVHDDVVDESDERRGFFSINALWKNKIAVLVGDYLLSQGLLLSVQHQQFELLKIVSRAVKEMSEGELLQIEKARRLDIDEHIYYDIIRQKTASLLAAACSAGTASTTTDENTIKQMHLFGEKAGIAFQIKDDLFDFEANSSVIGKPTGIDIKEKKMTLPLIYCLSNVDSALRRKIINIVKNESHLDHKVNEVIALVRSSGGLEYAAKKMKEYCDEAQQILFGFPESPARTSLLELLVYVTDRKQ